MKTRPGRNGGTINVIERGDPSLNPKGRPPKLPVLDILIAEVMADEVNGIELAKRILRQLGLKPLGVMSGRQNYF